MVSEANKRNRKYWNTMTAMRRRKRKLQNSMAHTSRPRAADLERWRVMQDEIASMERALVELEAGRHAKS